MSDTPAAKSEPMRPPMRRWLIAGAVLAGVLALAVAIIAAYRIPIAEKLIRDQLATMGLVDSDFTIETLTPWQATVTNLVLERTGAFGLRHVTLDVAWPFLSAPEVEKISLKGLRLRIGVVDGKPDFGPLAPLIGRRGAEPGAKNQTVSVLPPVDLVDALIEIDGLGGLLVLSLPRLKLSTATGGGSVLAFSDADLIHPYGQATVSGDGKFAADGHFEAALRIADAEGAWSGFDLAQAEGRISIYGAGADPKKSNITADLRFFDLTGPRGLQADGKIAATVTEGAGSLAGEMIAAGLGSDVKAVATFDIANTEKPVDLRVEAAAADLSRLGLPIPVAGSANAVIETQVGWSDILTKGSKAIKDLSLSVRGNGLSSPDVPGTWALDTELAVLINADKVGLRTNRQARVEGDLWRGRVDGSLSGEVTIDLSAHAATQIKVSELTVKSVGVTLPGEIVLPTAEVTVSGSGPADDFAGQLSIAAQAQHIAAGGNLSMKGMIGFKDRVLTYQPVDCDRMTINQAAAGDVDIRGPLTLCLKAGDKKNVLRVDFAGTAPPRIDIAADVRAKTPVMTAKSKDGLSTVLRTEKLAGSIAANTRRTGHPTIAIDVTGLDAAIPKFDMDLEGMGMHVRAPGSADPGWNFKYDLGAVTHVAFAPVSLGGSGRWQPGSISIDGTLRQKRSGLVASLSAKHDMKTGAGVARIDSLPLDIARVEGGVHAITPYLRPFVSALTGIVQISANTEWAASGIAPARVTATLSNAGITPARSVLPADFASVVAGLAALKVEATVPSSNPATGRASMLLTGGNLSWNEVRATGVSATVTLDSLWPPVSPPSQELRIARIDWGLPITDTRVLFQVLKTGGIHLERARVQGIGGRISVSDLALGPERLPERIIVEIEDLGLADIAQVFNIVGLEADGRISGRLPIELRADGAIAIRDGILKAIKAGTLSFKPPTRAQMAQGSTHVAMVLDVLENLNFEDLSVTVNGDARKDISLTLRIKGRNPKFQGGRPVDLTVTISGNIGEAIQAEMQNFNIQGLIDAGGKAAPLPLGASAPVQPRQ